MIDGHYIKWCVVYILLLFVQLGINVFFSVQLLLLAGLIIARHKDIQWQNSVDIFIVFLLSMLGFLLLEKSYDVNFLRELRYSFGAALLVCLLKIPPIKIDKNSSYIPIWFLVILFVLVCYQRWVVVSGGDFFIPAEWYAKSDDTALASNWVEHAVTHSLELNIRVSGPYSEPSYLGLVVLVVLSIVVNSECVAFKAKAIAVGLCFLIVFIAETVLGQLSVMFYLFSLSMVRRWVIKNWVVSGLIVLLLLLLIVGGIEFGDRVHSIISGNDESGYIRVFQPVRILISTLLYYPLGVPLTVASSLFGDLGMLGVFEDEPFHNGLINIIICYGWAGFFVCYKIFKGLPNRFLFIVVVAFIQSGSSFEFDKVFLISFCWIFYNQRVRF